jgi:hypothetical protein
VTSTLHSRNTEFWVATRLRTQRHKHHGRVISRNQTFVVQKSRPALGLTHPPFLWLLSHPFLEVKRPRREADHSSRSRVWVKNVWRPTLIPSIHLHDVVFINYVAKCTFAFHNHTNPMTITCILQCVKMTIITIRDLLKVCCILSSLTLAEFSVLMRKVWVRYN